MTKYLLLAVLFLQNGPPAADKPPELTEVEKLRIEVVRLTDQLAACQHRINVNQINTDSGVVVRQIEAAYPGWTVDWETGALVAKPKAKEK